MLNCFLFILADMKETDDPCNPSPCGANAQCNQGICTCLMEYHGDPYYGCRPECVLSSDCSFDKACMRSKCQDPCIGMCGLNAVCNVYNHVAVCSCPNGMTGDAFSLCNTIESKCFYNTWYLEFRYWRTEMRVRLDYRKNYFFNVKIFRFEMIQY